MDHPTNFTTARNPSYRVSHGADNGTTQEKFGEMARGMTHGVTCFPWNIPFLIIYAVEVSRVVP